MEAEIELKIKIKSKYVFGKYTSPLLEPSEFVDRKLYPNVRLYHRRLRFYINNLTVYRHDGLGKYNPCYQATKHFQRDTNFWPLSN